MSPEALSECLAFCLTCKDASRVTRKLVSLFNENEEQKECLRDMVADYIIAFVNKHVDAQAKAAKIREIIRQKLRYIRKYENRRTNSPSNAE